MATQSPTIIQIIAQTENSKEGEMANSGKQCNSALSQSWRDIAIIGVWSAS